MKKMPTIARVLLGLVFFVFGLNGFLNFIPPPPNMPEKVVAFMTGIMSTGYFLPFVKGTEVVCGLLLLTNSFVPLALVVLAPIIIHIVLVHTFLDTSGLPVAIVLVVLETYLAFFVQPYASVIKQLFRRKV